jgi:hypothetical protein
VTLAGTIHQTSGPLTFLYLSAGVALVSWGLGWDEKWRSFQPVVLVLALVIVAGFVATAYSFFTGGELGGLTQRIVLATLVTWIVLVASRLRSAGLSQEV